MCACIVHVCVCTYVYVYAYVFMCACMFVCLCVPVWGEAGERGEMRVMVTGVWKEQEEQ